MVLTLYLVALLTLYLVALLTLYLVALLTLSFVALLTLYLVALLTLYLVALLKLYLVALLTLYMVALLTLYLVAFILYVTSIPYTYQLYFRFGQKITNMNGALNMQYTLPVYLTSYIHTCTLPYQLYTYLYPTLPAIYPILVPYRISSIPDTCTLP